MSPEHGAMPCLHRDPLYDEVETAGSVPDNFREVIFYPPFEGRSEPGGSEEPGSPRVALRVKVPSQEFLWRRRQASAY